MTMPMRRYTDTHDDPVCLELLEADIRKPITTTRHIGQALAHLIPCYIDTARLVQRIDRKVFGNGSGEDGLVELVTDLNEWTQNHEKEELERMEIIHKNVEFIREKAALSPAPPLGQPPITVWSWFRDRVLPTLFVSLIMMIVSWIAGVTAILQAYRAGLLLPP